MRRIRWMGVTLGIVTTVSLAGVLLVFVSLVLEPYVSAITGTAPVGGVTSVTVTEERIRGVVVGLSVISAVFLAFFVGGLVAGRFGSSYAGLNGVVMGIPIVAVPLAALFVSVVLVLLSPIRNPGDVYTQSENLRMLSVALVVCSLISPVAVLSGFWGGRLGG
ncbi:hypothetical protein BH24ACT20_BH24ACT20_02160 [soil metagenome]